MTELGRFAPSATGRAHPGTLVSGLLAWLDAKSVGGQCVLRLEDLDPQRCSPAKTQALIEDLEWFGLVFDAVELQSQHTERHAAVLDDLAAAGVLYRCDCSRKDLQQRCGVAADGSRRYDNFCRNKVIKDWRSHLGTQAIRMRLLDQPITYSAEPGIQRACDPMTDFGDPVVVRRDGAVAYPLVSLIDDAAVGVTRQVRGVDLVHASVVQLALAQALNAALATTRYQPPPCRFHRLILEPRQVHGEELKWSKFHGAVAVPELQAVYQPAELCGLLAGLFGFGDGSPCQPGDLLATWDWAKVTSTDVHLTWDGQRLV